jgi:hypothetical protein
MSDYLRRLFNALARVLCVAIPFALAISIMQGSTNVVNLDLLFDNQSDQLSQQMEQLDPRYPDRYFRIGEQLASQAQTQLQRAVANQTLVIGMGLAYRQGDTTLAASMAIAIAEFEPDEETSALLWDLALLLDPARQSAWVEFRDRRASEFERVRAEAVRCLYAARNGDHQLASALFAKRPVRESLLSASQRAGFKSDYIETVLGDLIRSAESDPCRGRVFVTRRSGGEVRRTLCESHQRPVGTTMNDQQLKAILLIETVISTSQYPNERASWNSAFYMNQMNPSVDPSVPMMVSMYGADLSRPYWRKGEWSSKQ